MNRNTVANNIVQKRPLMGRLFSNSFLMIAFLVYASMVTNSRAESRNAREYQIKAAFLYNFGKFIDWPAESFENESAPVVYCIIGQDPFGNILDKTVKGKTLKGRRLIIERRMTVSRLSSCHLLYISKSEQLRVEQIFEPIKYSSVLTVGDMEGFANLGGIINLITRGNRIIFQINIDAANRARLKLSSRLLKLAIILEE